jgi:hypothetical protein
LKNAIKMFRTLFLMSKVPSELIIERKIKNERLLIQLLLKDSFIEIITTKFEHFLSFDPKNLTKMLSVIAL